MLRFLFKFALTLSSSKGLQHKHVALGKHYYTFDNPKTYYFIFNNLHAKVVISQN